MRVEWDVCSYEATESGEEVVEGRVCGCERTPHDGVIAVCTISQMVRESFYVKKIVQYLQLK